MFLTDKQISSLLLQVTYNLRKNTEEVISLFSKKMHDNVKSVLYLTFAKLPSTLTERCLFSHHGPKLFYEKEVIMICYNQS